MSSYRPQMHQDLTENAGNFSFDNRSMEKYEDNPVLLQNVRNNETFAVNGTSKDEQIWNLGSESGNYEYTGALTGNVRNIDVKTLVYSEHEVIVLPNFVHFDDVSKVENYNTTYIEQKAQNETVTLCRPLVFCGYDAYEGCKNTTFSTCEHCR